jgi:uncharacterized protein (TIGR02300 family)
VAKPELGTKRLCGACGAKFYDLNKDPILCPKCGTTFQVVVAPVSRAAANAAAAAAAAATAAAAAAAAAARAPKVEVQAPETTEVELVSLEDADAEATGAKTGEAAEGDDDIEVEETEEAPFIEEQEDGDEDVTDIVGEGREDEEET